MFGLEVAGYYLDAHRKQIEARRKLLESLSDQEREEFLKAEEKRAIEDTEERRHRELCASIEKAGKNACFW